MDLGDMRRMPKVFGGKLPATRATIPAREVDETPSIEAQRSSSKRPFDVSASQFDDPARRHKKVKILSIRHKSRRDEEGSRSHSRGKELEAPVEYAEETAGWEKLKNSTKIWNDPMAAEEFERGLLHPQLTRELYMLLSEVFLARAAKEMVLVISDSRLDLSEAMAATKERVTKLEKELEKKHEQDEVLQRLKTFDKELNEAQCDLSEARRQLKEA
ncbi:hypothetical protein BHE74_00012781 [Ensete ventricosum]|nr:hypothetical protein BHE74_00012781 [Ensete ventricosum]